MMAESRARTLLALVTGASRGIGCVIATQLALRGVRVALHYRDNRVAAEGTLARLAGTGHALFAADLTDPEGCTAAVAAGQRNNSARSMSWSTTPACTSSTHR